MYFVTSSLLGVRSIAMSVSVCLSVRSLTSNTTSELHEIFSTLPVASARSSSDDNAIRYVLPYS